MGTYPAERLLLSPSDLPERQPVVPCQEVQDPAAQRSVQSQILELRNQCGRHYGVKFRTIIHGQHPRIGVLIFQVGESSVQGEGNSIVCGTVTAVCKL